MISGVRICHTSRLSDALKLRLAEANRENHELPADEGSVEPRRLRPRAADKAVHRRQEPEERGDKGQTALM